MRTGTRTATWSSLVLLLLHSTLLPAYADGPLWDAIKRLGPRQGHPPKTSGDHALEELASNIDWLEHEIDSWGTIVPKTPDVWGEARLTQHKYEVEKELEKQIGQFDAERIHGAQFVSDQAFLAAALSMRMQQAGGSGVEAPTASAVIANTTVSSPGEAGLPTVTSNIDTAGTNELFGMSNGKLTVGGTGIRLEQIAELDQLKRYMDHLNELRRINEGDDSTDAPGYALNLVRIPISILPGTHSREGYGAEITVSATPLIGPELLPVAFKDFVINDLVDQLALPLTKYLNDEPLNNRNSLAIFDQREKLQIKFTAVRQNIINIVSALEIPTDSQLCEIFRNAQSPLFDPQTCSFNVAEMCSVSDKQFTEEMYRLLSRAIALGDFNIDQEMEMRTRMIDPGPVSPSSVRRIEQASQLPSLPSPTREAIRDQYRGLLNTNTPPALNQDETPQESLSIYGSAEAIERTAVELTDITTKVAELAAETKKLKAFGEQLGQLQSITGNQNSSQVRRSTLPFPPSQLESVHGMHGLAHIASTAWEAFRIDIVNRRVVHISDVQAFLRSELNAAYDLLSLESMQVVWDSESTGERQLFSAVRMNDVPAIDVKRAQFMNYVGPQAEHNMTATLAWAVFVESVLLNEKMIEDMRQTTSPLNCSMEPAYWMVFFGPRPSPEARQHFAEYVRVRWPIKTFTIDPVNSEQNIADVSSVYRQMQLAVALSVAGGEMGVNAALNTLRKVQRDIATIDLNRTVVGFAHADDTFGWRFYPRFQTSTVEGNMTVFFRDLIVGGPTDNQLERSKQIEPGMRECIALVLMPSFVPAVRFDTRGNWFKLTRPGHTAMSVKENLEYSRSVEAMRSNALQCVQCAHLYRPGEVERMLRRVDQLDRELPLQTLNCQVPIENSLGGFEIFSSGSRELAPELLGWYGAPGYDPQAGASFFLAGDNFSVHRSSVIAGNRSVAIDRMLSRQVIQISLPPGLPVMRDERLQEIAPGEYAGYIDVQVGTPYGVSGHLLIPAVESSDEPAVSIQFLEGYLRMVGNIKLSKDPTQPTKLVSSIETLKFQPEGSLRIQLPRLNAVRGQATLNVELFQQGYEGPQPFNLGTTISLNATIDSDSGVMTIPTSEMTTLITAVKSQLDAYLAPSPRASLRLPLLLGGRVNLPGVLEDEQVLGSIPLEIDLLP